MDKRFFNTPHGSRKFMRGLTASALYEPLAYFRREIERLEEKIALETDPDCINKLKHWREFRQSNYDAIHFAQQMIYEENEAIDETIKGPTLVATNTETTGD